MYIQSSTPGNTAFWTRVVLMATSLIHSLVGPTKEAVLLCYGPSGAEVEVIEDDTDRSWSAGQQH